MCTANPALLQKIQSTSLTMNKSLRHLHPWGSICSYLCQSSKHFRPSAGCWRFDPWSRRRQSSPALPGGYLLWKRHAHCCSGDSSAARRICKGLLLSTHNRSFYTLHLSKCALWHNICMNKRGKPHVFLAEQRWYDARWLSVSRYKGQRKAWHSVDSPESNKAE